MHSFEPYVYQPFQNPREQIRLLTVKPNRDQNAIVESKLSIHNIPQSNASRRAQIRPLLRLPFYIAVSYVWGTGAALRDRKDILLDDCLFSVTSSLYEGLREARIQASGWPPVLWFDAICIDQSNEDEKAAQIPLMREIYHYSQLMRFIYDLNTHPFLTKTYDWFTGSYTTTPGRGESVYTWLRGLVVGKFTEFFLKVAFSLLLKPPLDALKLLLNKCQDKEKYQEGHVSSRLESDRRYIQRFEDWEPSEACLQAVQSADLVAMARCMQNAFGSQTQYFNRMWTFQEVIASPIAIIHCSKFEFTMDNFLRAVYYLHRTQGLDQSLVDTITTLWTVKNNWNLRVRLPLRQLLFHCRYRDCIDPKDKIFALLGLIHNRHDPRLQPDNKLSVAQVYANATKYIASSEGSLDVICVRGEKAILEGLPSWAPDFRRFGVGDGNKMLLDASGQSGVFRASAAEPYENLGPPDQEIEPIWTWVATQDQYSEPKEQKMLSNLSQVLRLLSQLHQVSDSASKSELWADMESEVKQLSSAPYPEQNIQYLLTLMCGQVEPGTPCGTDDTTELLQNASVRNPDGDTALSLLSSAIQNGIRGRRLAVLDGGVIGAVPDDARLGDTVCVLVGCSVPVCLRKCEDEEKWTLVGGCYVCGYMNGEAIEERDSGQLEENTYSLV
ncbi:uncharacterized protein PAC_00335 [Phialocephala subalpina]|uniref:Heterokaryon incompatibility domain-containing protein n=1 Tax=Phialocephala subalpina TaxID=576137 RepID=A0A1L7WCF0_9HELO|nr:uncharacterized protein PAC_00335 [Phialocephala subalpina]